MVGVLVERMWKRELAKASEALAGGSKGLAKAGNLGSTLKTTWQCSLFPN